MFLDDSNQFPDAFHLIWTALHLVTIPSLISDVYRNASAVMSPVCSGDVDALTPGRLLTGVSLTCAGCDTGNSPDTSSTHSPDPTHRPGHWSLSSSPGDGGQWSLHPTAVSCLVIEDGSVTWQGKRFGKISAWYLPNSRASFNYQAGYKT